jgi:hypothetical protein
VSSSGLNLSSQNSIKFYSSSSPEQISNFYLKSVDLWSKCWIPKFFHIFFQLLCWLEIKFRKSKSFFYTHRLVNEPIYPCACVAHSLSPRPSVAHSLSPRPTRQGADPPQSTIAITAPPQCAHREFSRHRYIGPFRQAVQDDGSAGRSLGAKTSSRE